MMVDKIVDFIDFKQYIGILCLATLDRYRIHDRRLLFWSHNYLSYYIAWSESQFKSTDGGVVSEDQLLIKCSEQEQFPCYFIRNS